MQKKIRVGIIGCGNIVRSLVVGGKDKLKDKVELHCFNPTQSKAVDLLKQFEGQGQVWESIQTFPVCDYYILGHKPKHLKEVSQELKSNKNFSESKGVIVSLLSAVEVKNLKQFFPAQYKVMRAMPNLNSQVGSGVSFFVHAELSPEELSPIQDFFAAFSKVYSIDESQMDVLTMVGGSLPGVFFEVGQMLKRYLIKNKVKAPLNALVIANVFEGVGKMMSESYLKDQIEFDVLRDHVTSKGGTTEAILKSLWANKLEETLSQSLDQGVSRAQELQKLVLS